MANYPQTKLIIDNNIATNHNEDITAVVLNMVLTALIDYTKDESFSLSNLITTVDSKIGDLLNLTTVDKTNIVNAINELVNSPGLAWVSPTDKAIPIWDLVSGGLINSKIIETAVGASLNGRFKATGLVGRCESIVSNTGNLEINMNNLSEHYFATLTEATTLVLTNMISDTETACITMTVTGTQTLTLPGTMLPISDAYDGNGSNEIVINVKKGGGSPNIVYTIINV